MNRNWSLADETYRAFHRWPTLAVFIIAGCLVGWFVSLLLPPYFRAITQVYVALNPYRTYSDTNFLALARPKYSNIDDYKDWQMTQLESVIFLDEFIDATLKNLRDQNPAWMDYSSQDLRDSLEADWRSAGTWSLLANSSDPAIAAQASSAWGEVVVEKVKAAVEASRQTINVDQELQSNSDLIQKLEFRINELEQADSEIEDWKKSVSDNPPDQPLEPQMRAEILKFIALPASFTPAWKEILDSQPVENASLADYQPWIDQAQLTITQEIEHLKKQADQLKQDRVELSKLFDDSSKASLGLSPNLEIESIEALPPEKVHPTSTFILIGAASGFLMWILTQLVMITRRQVYQ
jgi:hypothetical protein